MKEMWISGQEIIIFLSQGFIGKLNSKLQVAPHYRYPIKNAPQGVENVHCECRISTDSNDQGNNAQWSTLILTGKALYKKQVIIILIKFSIIQPVHD